MTAWFGPSWGAPVCDPVSHVDTPVGSPCCECDVAIVDGDSGFRLPYTSTGGLLTYHRVCFLRTVIPCAMWPDEFLFDLPPRWATHRALRHPELDDDVTRTT